VRVLIFSDNFVPEVCAPATRIFQHCKHLVESGDSVTVITCHPNFPQGKLFPGFKNSLFRIENIDGITVVRVWSYMHENKGFLLRTLDHLSYAVSSLLVSLYLSIKVDLVISTSPQFFAIFPGIFFAKLKKIKFIVEIRDLWPEGIIFLNRGSRIFKLLTKIEEWIYKRSDGIIVVTSSFRGEIIRRTQIDGSFVKVVYNGSDLVVKTSNSDYSENIRKLKNEGKCIVGYAGTIGESHGIDFLIKQIMYFSKTSCNLHFVIIGAGSSSVLLNNAIKEQHLTNVSILGFLNKENTQSCVREFDVGLVMLRDFEPYRKVIPSKMFELAAMDVPILLGLQGEALQILNKYGAGRSFYPENEEEFRLVIIEFIQEWKIKMLKVNYKQGLQNLAKDFSRQNQAKELRGFLKQILGNDKLSHNGHL
jgi:glycosyltransferase involved in cell wall biosynthesis